jgi:hypothetical protein
MEIAISKPSLPFIPVASYRAFWLFPIMPVSIGQDTRTQYKLKVNF